MTHARTIADRLGRREIAARLDVGETAVSNAVVRGAFPASWYIVIRSMCDDIGVACPDDAFHMKRDSQYVGKCADLQGDGS